MKIKSIKLKNFQSYYGEENDIQFTSGLNVITGSIASGKSKLFDAFYWTLNDKIFVTGKDWVKTKELNIDFINDKAKFECNDINSLVETYVEIVVSQKNSKIGNKETDFTIRRELFIKRRNAGNSYSTNTWDISPNKLSVEYTNPKNFNAEIRNGVDAERFIEDLFPSKISPYIWFQGEALDKLIDFNNKGTIKRAIDYISYVPLYRNMNEIIGIVNDKIERKKITRARAITSDINKYDSLTKAIEEQRRIIENNKLFIEEKSLSLGKHTDSLEEIEIQLSALSEYPILSENKTTLESKIFNINEKLERLDVDERKKFSSLWMLNGSNQLLKKAGESLIEFEDYRQSLIDKEYKLPDDVPGDVYLKKMLNEELCMICDRVAEKGSDAYKSIEGKLNRKTKPEYLNKEIEELNNRVFTYKAKLSSLIRHISSVSTDIISHKRSISQAVEERAELLEKISKINDQIESLYTNRGIDISEGAKTFRNKNSEYKTLNEIVRNLSRKIEVAKASITDSLITIKQKQDELDKISKSNTNVNVVEEEIVKYTNYLTNYISDIERREYEKLIGLIESEANMFFRDITAVNNTIDGNIHIDRTTYRVLNVDDDGRELHNYNTGHYTLMKMCIINAIISLTNEFKDESYPFITDAPTSNLDAKATYAYLETIANTFEQSIVITKDISEDELTEILNLDFISSLHHLKIENNKGSEKMNREEAYTKINNLKI